MLLIPFRSATVDSDLFSRYFGYCPVITAQGRTHPVTTHFLEEIYESINYLLAPDSPAALRSDSSIKEKVLDYSYQIHHLYTSVSPFFTLTSNCLPYFLGISSIHLLYRPVSVELFISRTKIRSIQLLRHLYFLIYEFSFDFVSGNVFYPWGCFIYMDNLILFAE